jgi:diguanylate cyclase (GGDEF)-like protein/PAS domain S-box-containing protein
LALRQPYNFNTQIHAHKMQRLAKPHSAHTLLWRLLHNLRIRQLLLLVLGCLSLIAIMAIGWNAIHVYQEYINAEQLSGSNKVSQEALSLNAHLARERGFTASLLASSAASSAHTDNYLSLLRAHSNDALHLLQKTLEENTALSSIGNARQQLKKIIQRLNNSRSQTDYSLQNNDNTISYTDWINAISQHIDEVAKISRTIMAPLHGEEDVVYYGLSIKEAFFTLSENTGRERALISTVIAQQRPFHKNESRLLNSYQHINKFINKHLAEVLGFLPKTPIIKHALHELEINHLRYQALRNTIIQQSSSNQPYIINANEWFDRSTEAVDAILNLSFAVDQHFNDGIRITKANAQYTVIALLITLFLVVSIFIFTFILIYRRILMPLRELELSANTIAKGDFTRITQVLAQDEFGELASAFEIMRDYLLNDREQRQMAENELRKLSMALEQSVSSIIITNANGYIEYVNPQFFNTTGYTGNEVIGHKLNIISSGKTPQKTYDDLWKTIKDGRVWQGELLNRKKNGEFYWDMVSISPVRDTNNMITHFIGIQHDITLHKQMEQQLNFMAYHDELTELPNRALLSDRFEQLTHLSHSDHREVAFLMLDLDRFKLINDSLGHSIGDQHLIEVAKRLKDISRASDTIARYGGDEFVILASSFSSINSLIDIAKRIIAISAKPADIQDHSLHFSISVGISIWPNDGEDMNALLRQADTAMNHAKALGGGRIQFYTDELNQKATHRLKLENDLHEAIEHNQFELYYQPQIHLGSGKIVGTEALIRWNHPELGLVSPLDFIPLAEETNLIQPIGDWVLKTACVQAALWKKNFNSELLMAVNVSALQLDDADFIDRLTNIINQSGLPFESLEIEVTESSVMHQPDKMINVLNNITSLGIKLALDDFGTGYSSLSYLRRFPFDKLKIDQSFIRDIKNNQEDSAITQTIIKLAHNLNMTVIAEGVETRSQATILQDCSCDEIQGYLISRPVPAKELEKLLQQSTAYF